MKTVNLFHNLLGILILVLAIKFCLYCTLTACDQSCQNGGTQEASSCECSCPAGFFGSYCENKGTIMADGMTRLLSIQ